MAFTWFLLANVLIAFGLEKESEKLKVSIYYETYCPCSVSFLSKQFYPAYKKLGEHLDVELVPTGHTMHDYNGSWIISCKHGQQECYGNKIHGCVLAMGINQAQSMEFINCIVEGKYSDEELEACVNIVGIEWTPIKKCIDSSIGDDVLASYGNMVKSVNLTHIPAVIFDGVYNKTIDELARRGFLQTACSLLRGRAPDVCTDLNLYLIV